LQIENKIFKDFMKKRLDTQNNWLYMNITNDGIELMSCDSSTVAMSSSKLDKKCVKQVCDITGKVLINNIDRYNKVINNIGNSKDITIDITDNNIIIKTDTEVHTLCRMDEQTLEDFPIPNLNYDDGISFSIRKDMLNRIVDMAGTFSVKDKPILRFIVTKTSINYKMEVNDESVEGIPIKILTPNDKEFEVTFIMDYFIKIISCLTAETIKLNLKEDYPLQINEKLGDFITTKFIIAPWIDNDEEVKGDESATENMSEV